jgi:hypothetical protein
MRRGRGRCAVHSKFISVDCIGMVYVDVDVDVDGDGLGTHACP